ncbi:hypothetical protein [Vibrio penaeicida]|uniref:Lipoprotein n=1 Tax=Vibrio penaeicida TaxID=104609 RepID=A0AAV5NKN5_9VIBR|nr:hypothetical protein [Vibrio penaeicida]RTZ23010.1 hypothetical protein EKN09_11040 [Vibrio penaeicida]GLQ71060.1 hypothetical protein GCM10007932_04200 [Vibrio penaeicida]
MRYLSVFLLAIVGTITGCSTGSNSIERELNSSLLTENFIPYPNSPYQRERPEIIMKDVSADSDFVIIETTKQYVIWKGEANSISLDEAKSLVGILEPSTGELFVDGDTELVEGNECRPIVNDAGSVIGEVKVCSGTFCNDAFVERYSCKSDTCEIKQDLTLECEKDAGSHPFCEGNEKLSETCEAFPELIACSKASVVCGNTLDK